MIVFMGVPGAGKSTMAKLMSAREGIPFFPEPVDNNPYLSDYYKDPEKYAFNMQIFLLHRMFQHALNAQHMKQCTMDMHMVGNDIFARVQHANNMMSRTDFDTYMDISKSFKSMVKHPDLIVYLRCTVKTAVDRIMTRGRRSELEAPLSYWYDLHEMYERWYDSYIDSPKIMINVDDLDFVNDEGEEDYIIDAVLESL